MEGGQEHIDTARTQAVPYSSPLDMKSALRWWMEQFLEGLLKKARDEEKEAENTTTILILAAVSSGALPRKGDVIYFELPKRLGEISRLRADIHLYVFDSVPKSPVEALRKLGTAKMKATCKAVGLELERGGRELEADWEIKGQGPTLSRTSKPFRPTRASDAQQVRASIGATLSVEYEYLLDPGQARVGSGLWARFRPAGWDWRMWRTRRSSRPRGALRWQLVRWARSQRGQGDHCGTCCA